MTATMISVDTLISCLSSGTLTLSHFLLFVFCSHPHYTALSKNSKLHLNYLSRILNGIFIKLSIRLHRAATPTVRPPSPQIKKSGAKKGPGAPTYMKLRGTHSKRGALILPVSSKLQM
jgi:hypothetical protein